MFQKTKAQYKEVWTSTMWRLSLIDQKEEEESADKQFKFRSIIFIFSTKINNMQNSRSKSIKISLISLEATWPIQMSIWTQKYAFMNNCTTVKYNDEGTRNLHTVYLERIRVPWMNQKKDTLLA